MGTMRFVTVFIAGLAAILAIAQPASGGPCSAMTPLVGPAFGAAIAPSETNVAFVIPGKSSWTAAALKGCVNLKSLITPGNSKLLGFDTVDDASLAEIGLPFDIFTIGLHQLKEYYPGNPVAPLVKQLDSRLYPLRVRGVVSSALVVSFRRSTNELATTLWGLQELARLVTQYKKAESDFIVWVPALNFHFLGNRPGDYPDETLMLTPLITRTSYGLIVGQPVPAAVVFALLAQQARLHDEYNPG